VSDSKRREAIQLLVDYKVGLDWKSDKLNKEDLRPSLRRRVMLAALAWTRDEVDSYNQNRALQYARFYLQEKALSRLGVGSSRGYAFAPFSALLARNSELQRFYGARRRAEPILFDVSAEYVPELSWFDVMAEHV
jgi:hypothetical protein